MLTLKQKYANQEKAMKKSFIFSAFNDGLEEYSSDELNFLSSLINDCTENKSSERVQLANIYLEKIVDYITEDESSYPPSISSQWLKVLIKPEDTQEIKINDKFISLIKTIFKEAKLYSELEQIKDLMLYVFSQNWLETKDYQYFITQSVETIYASDEPHILHELMQYIIENEKVVFSEENLNKVPLIVMLSDDSVFLKFFKVLKEQEEPSKEFLALDAFIKIFNPCYQEKFENNLQEKWILEYFVPKISLNGANRLNIDTTENKEKAFLYIAKEQKISEIKLQKLFFNEKTIAVLDAINLEPFNHMGKHAGLSTTTVLLHYLWHYLSIYNDMANELNFSIIEMSKNDSIETLKNKFNKLNLESIIEPHYNSQTKKIKL